MSESKQEPDDYPVVQVYSAECWHQEQAIVMNEPGRLLLIDALANLAGKPRQMVAAMTGDGEGYALMLHLKPWDDIARMPAPYLDTDLCGTSWRDSPGDPREDFTAEDVVTRVEWGGWETRIRQEIMAALPATFQAHYEAEGREDLPKPCNCLECRAFRVFVGGRLREKGLLS